MSAGDGPVGVASADGAIDGLSTSQVSDRVAAGRVNVAAHRTSRPLRAILRANLLTRFNLLLGSLLGVILLVGPLQDALFGVVLVANTGIGVVQEWRAKRVLDRLAIVVEPRARAVRSGAVIEIAAADVVLDDVLVLALGDQIVADAEVLAGEIEVDESLLTGESRPVRRRGGDRVLSGTVVIAGTARARVTAVGPDAYAARLETQARRFRLARSELRAGVDVILRMVTYAMIPIGVLVVASQFARHDTLPETLRSCVAALVPMVPEGLVLLTSMALAAGVLRLARRRVVTRDLSSVEVLARVDTVCVDKTGTLTSGELEMSRLEPVARVDPNAAAALGALAGGTEFPNATLRAISAAYPAPDWPVLAAVPFESSRRFSAADLGVHGMWALGAPDTLLASASGTAADADRVLAAVRAHTVAGHRVLLLARADRLDPALAGVRPIALAVLRDVVRPDAADTLAYFAAQGVSVRVISGDDPATVAAIASSLGLRGERGDAGPEAVDARTLPAEEAPMADAVDGVSVFGRVVPEQKRAIVHALQRRGHVVAMTGDGVNDVLALEAADLGVAMGTGTAAARAAADLVLLDDAFAALPHVVAEGRRVLANIERVSMLFVTKTVYATLLALAIGFARWPFPFLPRHLTLVSALTIGIPGFVLALEPNSRRARPGFVVRTLRFAAPAGFVAAAATFAAYALTGVEGGSLPRARTVATIALCAVALEVLALLARPVSAARGGLVVAMGVAFLGALAVPAARSFFALALLPAVQWLTIGLIAAAAGAALVVLTVAVRRALRG